MLAGLREAKQAGAYTVLLCGRRYDETAAEAVLAVPSQDTPRIQEMHILIGHYLAEAVEQRRFGSRSADEKAEDM